MRFFTSSSIPLDRCKPPIYLESCREFGIPAVNLAWPPDWEGYRNVPRLLELLRSLPEDEIILISDAWDIFYTTGPEAVEQAFLSYNKPIIFAAEHREPTGRWSPRVCTSKPWPPSPTRYFTINGGCVAAYSGAFLNLWTSPGFWPSPLFNAQVAYNHWYIEHPDQIGIDTHCRLCMCLYGEDTRPESIFERGRIINKYTGEYPCLVHGNAYKREVYKLWDILKSHQSSFTYHSSSSPQDRRDARWRQVGKRQKA